MQEWQSFQQQLQTKTDGDLPPWLLTSNLERPFCTALMLRALRSQCFAGVLEMLTISNVKHKVEGPTKHLEVLVK